MMSRSSVPPSAPRTVHAAFLRYAAVGILSNGFLYGLNLGLVTLGLTPAQSVMIAYPLGVCLTFWANWRWTFKSDEVPGRAFIKYLVVYALGYVFMLGAVFVLDRISTPPWLTLLFAIGATAVFIFTLLRVWAFSRLHSPND
jgi:putative flippase GtrA